MEKQDFETLMDLTGIADTFNYEVSRLADLRNYPCIFAFLDFLKEKDMSLEAFVGLLQDVCTVINESTP